MPGTSSRRRAKRFVFHPSRLYGGTSSPLANRQPESRGLAPDTVADPIYSRRAKCKVLKWHSIIGSDQKIRLQQFYLTSRSASAEAVLYKSQDIKFHGGPNTDPEARGIGYHPPVVKRSTLSRKNRGICWSEPIPKLEMPIEIATYLRRRQSIMMLGRQVSVTIIMRRTGPRQPMNAPKILAFSTTESKTKNSFSKFHNKHQAEKTK